MAPAAPAAALEAALDKLRHPSACTAGAADPRPLEGRLSFDQIMSVDSYDALKELYERNGAHFLCEAEFRDLVREDWSRELARRYAEAGSDTAEPLDPFVVHAAGTAYTLVGVIHDAASALNGRYRELIESAMDGQKIVLYEQGLSAFFPRQQALEVCDYSANSFGRTLLEGAKGGLIMPLVSGLMLYRLCRPFSTGEANIERLRRHPEENGCGSYPTYIEMHLQLQAGTRCSHSIRRSAYQAEFLRAYRRGADKTFMVGANHNRYIAYFLKHGAADQAIVKLAQKDAYLAEHAPARYRMRQIAAVVKETLGLGIGMIAGASPYLYGAFSI